MSLPVDLDGHLWPSPVQQELLKAALAADDAALQHYWSWRRSIDIEQEFDSGSFRLLPLLYANMSRLGLTDNLMGRLKGAYRRAWCEAQIRLEQAATVLRLLHGQGIETLLIKGIPLAVGYYDSPSLRPMADLDVVVRRADASRAIRLLDANGWKRGPTARDEDVLFHHAMQFFHPQGGELDLHWHVLQECRDSDAERQFWGRARPLEVKGIATRQLDPTDLLFHAVIHGVRWNPEPPIRWIADAAIILRRAGSAIEWDRLIVLADRYRLSHRLGLGLSFLVERFAMPVPPRVVEAITQHPTTLVERIENTVALRDAERMYAHPLVKNWVIFARYCRIQQARNPAEFLNGFSHFLRVKWALAGRSQIPGVILRGLLRRLRDGDVRR